MRVVSPDLTFPLVEEDMLINETIIEREELFYEIVFDINEQFAGNSGRIVFSEAGEPCSVKSVVLITDPLSVNINTRTTINKLYKYIEAKVTCDHVPEAYYHALRTLYETISPFCDTFYLEPGQVEDVSLSQVLSLFQMRFPDDFLNFGERIIDYLEVHRELFGTKLFVFVQIRAFIPSVVFEDLLSSVRYGQFQVWFIESSERNKPLNTNHYRRLIVDRDGCEI